MKQIYPCIFLLLLLFLAVQKIEAQASIQLTTGRSFSNFEASIPEAGSDLNPIYTTSPSLINISLNTRRRYRISIRKNDTNWDNTLTLHVRRTGSGIGTRGGRISGGTNYIQLTDFNQTFFEGRRSRSNIPIQYEFRNITVLVPADGHTTAVVYTFTSL